MSGKPTCIFDRLAVCETKSSLLAVPELYNNHNVRQFCPGNNFPGLVARRLVRGWGFFSLPLACVKVTFFNNCLRKFGTLERL